MNTLGCGICDSFILHSLGGLYLFLKTKQLLWKFLTFGAFSDMPWNKKSNPDILKKQPQQKTLRCDFLFDLIRSGSLFVKGLQCLGKQNISNVLVL